MFFIKEVNLTEMTVAELIGFDIDCSLIKVPYGDKLLTPTSFEEIKNRDGLEVVRFMVSRKETDRPAGYNLQYHESVLVDSTPELIISKDLLAKIEAIKYTTYSNRDLLNSDYACVERLILSLDNASAALESILNLVEVTCK